MIPEIEFRYSNVYDNRYKNTPAMEKYLKDNSKEYPSSEEIREYIKEIKKIWDKEGNAILGSIQKITKMRWKERKVICYVVGIARPISDPLTIRLFKDKEYFIDVLTHELIHQILSQNPESIKKWYSSPFIKKYSKEPATVRRHLFIHSVHYIIASDIYDRQRLNKIMGKTYIDDLESSEKELYLRSWEIIKKETPEKIIKKFHEVTK